MSDLITLGIGGDTDDMTPLILFGLSPSSSVVTTTPDGRVFIVQNEDRDFTVQPE